MVTDEIASPVIKIEEPVIFYIFVDNDNGSPSPYGY